MPPQLRPLSKVVAPLVELLCDGDADAKASAARGLAAIASKSNYCARNVGRLFVDLLKHGNDEGRSRAAKAIAAHAGIGEGRPREDQHVLKEQQKVGAFGRQIVEARRVHLLSEIFMEYGLHSLKPDHRPSLDSPRRYRGDANDLGVAAMDALGSLAYACAGSNDFIAQLDVDIPEQLAGLLLHEMDVGNKKTPRRFGRGMVGRENETRMGAAENRPTDGRAFRCSQGEARRRWRVVDALVQVLYWRNKARGVEDQDECFEGLDRFVGHLPGRYETLGREIERLAAQHERLAKLTRRRRGGLHRRRRRRSQNNAAKATARRRPRRALKAVKDDRVSAPARACVKEERAEAQHRCDTAERELEDARDRVLRVVRTEPDAPRQILFLPSISSCVRRAVIRSKGQTTCPFCNGRHRPAHPNYELKLEPGFLV